MIYVQYLAVGLFALCGITDLLTKNWDNAIRNFSLFTILFGSFFGFTLFPRWALVLINLGIAVFNPFSFRYLTTGLPHLSFAFTLANIIQLVCLVIAPLLLAIYFGFGGK